MALPAVMNTGGASSATAPVPTTLTPAQVYAQGFGLKSGGGSIPLSGGNQALQQYIRQNGNGIQSSIDANTYATGTHMPLPYPNTPAQPMLGGLGATTHPQQTFVPASAFNPPGKYMGMGTNAGVAAGDKVYRVSNKDGSFTNFVYRNGQLIAKYNHNGDNVPIVTGQPSVTVGPAHPAPVPKSTGTGTKGKTTTGVPASVPSGLGSGMLPSSPSSGSAMSASGSGTPTSGSSYIQGLQNQWNQLMNTYNNLNPNTDPVLQQQIAAETAADNGTYFQQYLKDRDAIGARGLGGIGSGYTTAALTQANLGEQEALAKALPALIDARQKNLLGEATAYGDMLKTQLPYYQTTADQQATVNTDAQKLALAQLNAAGYADVNGKIVPTLNYTKDMLPYSQLTADQLATLSGQLPGGGMTLSAQKDAAQIQQWATQDKLKASQLSLDYAKFGQTQQYNAAKIAELQSLATNRTQSAVLSSLKDRLDTLSTQIDNIRTNNPNDPALNPNKKGTPAYEYNQVMNQIAALGTQIVKNAASGGGSSGN